MAAHSASGAQGGMGLLIFFFDVFFDVSSPHEMILMHLELVDPFNCVCDHLHVRSQTQFVRMRGVYIIVAYKVSKYREHTMK